MGKARNDQVFVLLASGFEECDVTTVTRTLRRTGMPVVLVGLTAGPIRGCFGISLLPDKSLCEVETDSPLAVVLPGGIQGVRQLSADPRVYTLLRRAMDQDGYVLALDLGYMVLSALPALMGTEKRPAKGSVSNWPGALLSPQRVVIEGQLIFARDSGAAQESALTLAALLDGESLPRGGR